MKAGESLRVLLQDHAGVVEITTDLVRADGAPLIRVEAVSDTERFGPDDQGREWDVENKAPGVVIMAARAQQES